MALVFGDKSTKFKSGLRYWWDRSEFGSPASKPDSQNGRAHILLPSRIQGDREISDTAWEFFLLELGSFSHSSLRQPSNGGGKQIAANYTFPRLSIQGDP
ncbi:hypothetical protein NC652_038103 [Populus alba x Populus x berolinensis]|uniref:Uncharacterized protein n=1 Tax=Populus alba x Populus x berolinensis TaxID=444605 RepID=A0AAD6LFV1_9ROSI|nr:hypothetical protein NC652_038103 [Populus alba x Populus x berolinensis]KAJ6959956.1 hypothetical protein NC653_038108 [Populus alba x Populus x berolinensis]